jgi:hypothetical protein
MLVCILSPWELAVVRFGGLVGLLGVVILQNRGRAGLDLFRPCALTGRLKMLIKGRIIDCT